MTADKKQSIYQSPDQHTNPNQLTSLQSPLQSLCPCNTPQPSTAIMDAPLHLDMSQASIPSFAPLPGVLASQPQHQHHPQITGQPSPASSPVSHLGCMEPVNGVPVQQHSSAPRTAAEKTGETSCSHQSAPLHTFQAMPVFANSPWLFVICSEVFFRV